MYSVHPFLVAILMPLGPHRSLYPHRGLAVVENLVPGIEGK